MNQIYMQFTYVYQIITLYTLNLYSVKHQLYLNKARDKKRTNHVHVIVKYINDQECEWGR